MAFFYNIHNKKFISSSEAQRSLLAAAAVIASSPSAAASPSAASSPIRSPSEDARGARRARDENEGSLQGVGSGRRGRPGTFVTSLRACACAGCV